MKTVGTLKELDVKPGDVVEWRSGIAGVANFSYTVGIGNYGFFVDASDGKRLSGGTNWHIVSRSADTPKLWRDMTPEEKGALLLAHHEGRDLEYWRRGSGGWASCPSLGIYDNKAYRIKHEPKVETVTIYGRPDVQWVLEQCKHDTHKITFTTIDGKPDCASIKMEEFK